MTRKRAALWLVLAVVGGCFYNTRDSYVCKAKTDCPLDRTYCCVEGRCHPSSDVDASAVCE